MPPATGCFSWRCGGGRRPAPSRKFWGQRNSSATSATGFSSIAATWTQELNWYHPHGAAIIQAFVNGINAYIDQTEKNPALLTPEFKMLGIRPGKWTPAVVISRFNGLLGNLDEEMNTALAVRAIGAEKVKDLEHYQPADPDLRIDPAIDAQLLSKEHPGTLRHFPHAADIHA